MPSPYTTAAPYRPTAKPAAASNLYHLRNPKLYTWVLIVSLFFTSYLLGSWPTGRSIINRGESGTNSAAVPRNLAGRGMNVMTSHADATTALDFEAHHGQKGPDNVAAIKLYAACDARYSEYTPCEDPQRSLRFDRRRLIYRERHCPEKGDELKCRVPAPHGYKIPFKWPTSRDLAWYANVPHKELTIEKADQKWIRYEGEHFRFPGGGTMFPNGADAYIDDIDKLINLRDGSIRTAIDTGCGVCNMIATMHSENPIFISQFSLMEVH